MGEGTGSVPPALAQSRCTVGAQRGHPALSHPTPILQGCGAILEHLRAQSASRSVDIYGGPTVCYGWTGASFLPHRGRGRNPHGGDGGLARGHQGGGSLGNHVSTEGVSSDEEDSGSKRGGLRRKRRQVQLCSSLCKALLPVPWPSHTSNSPGRPCPDSAPGLCLADFLGSDALEGPGRFNAGTVSSKAAPSSSTLGRTLCRRPAPAPPSLGAPWLAGLTSHPLRSLEGTCLAHRRHPWP